MNLMSIASCTVIPPPTNNLDAVRPQVVLPNGVIKLDPLLSTFLPTLGLFSDPAPKPLGSLVQVTLHQKYLVNTIEIQGLPNQHATVIPVSQTDDHELPMLSMSEDDGKEKFSYSIQISRNGQDWIKLFNYSNYVCHRVQKLHFPTLDFR